MVTRDPLNMGFEMTGNEKYKYNSRDMSEK
jgi:hypothetical protein